MSARSPFFFSPLSPPFSFLSRVPGVLFFFSPLSPPFSFLSRVVSRLMGVKNAQFRCRSGENGQILRGHLFKNPGRCCKQILPGGEKWPNFGWWVAFSAFLGHFSPFHANNCCKQMLPGCEKWPNFGWWVAFSAFLGHLAHFIPTSTRIFENGTARFRCLSGVSRALRLRSETISKVGNIKIMIARSPFFFSRLSSLLFSLPCGF